VSFAAALCATSASEITGEDSAAMGAIIPFAELVRLPAMPSYGN